MEDVSGGEAYIRTGLKLRPDENNAEAHKMLGVTHLHWDKRKIQRAWRGMCTIILILRLEGQEPMTENIRSCQADKLGHAESHTPIIEPGPILKQRSFERY
jgi:hypothetical protein